MRSYIRTRIHGKFLNSRFLFIDIFLILSGLNININVRSCSHTGMCGENILYSSFLSVECHVVFSPFISASLWNALPYLLAMIIFLHHHLQTVYRKIDKRAHWHNPFSPMHDP